MDGVGVRPEQEQSQPPRQADVDHVFRAPTRSIPHGDEAVRALRHLLIAHGAGSLPEQLPVARASHHRDAPFARPSLTLFVCTRSHARDHHRNPFDPRAGINGQPDLVRRGFAGSGDDDTHYLITSWRVACARGWGSWLRRALPSPCNGSGRKGEWLSAEANLGYALDCSEHESV